MKVLFVCSGLVLGSDLAPGQTPGAVLRDHIWQGSGDHMGCHARNESTALSLQPNHKSSYSLCPDNPCGIALDSSCAL